MKLKFKDQQFQQDAVCAVCDVFGGQPCGEMEQAFFTEESEFPLKFNRFSNAEILLSREQILENLRAVQRSRGIAESGDLLDGNGNAKSAERVNLDVEMETGTGKTFVYIKTIFELNKRYGWGKFIVVVPTIAIREGVKKSFSIMEETFAQQYAKRAKWFVYDSANLEQVKTNFYEQADLCVMIVNVQAFNSTKAKNELGIEKENVPAARGAGKGAGGGRLIYSSPDRFGSRRPIDLIAECRPILILDEPQRMEGPATKEALRAFNPLFSLYYSATHKTAHNCVYRLDAIDAFRQKLVKRIEAIGIETHNHSGALPYLYFDSVRAGETQPEATLEIEVRSAGGDNKRRPVRVKKGAQLYALSGKLEVYKDFVVSEINAIAGTLEFTNGEKICVGEVTGDIDDKHFRRIQIRAAITAHLQKEASLFKKNIKVLTLFFVGAVAEYRKYDGGNETDGEFARVFEEEYERCVADAKADFLPEGYAAFLDKIDVKETHKGYFAQDKNHRFVDPRVDKKGDTAGECKDSAAYDLILKDKERLLSPEEPTRFIFSHSALREGWDNPNVFVICLLRHANVANVGARRQEVGRGLRLCVNGNGDRVDGNADDGVNVLTVVANEGFATFAGALQKEIQDACASRPKTAEAGVFAGRFVEPDVPAMPAADGNASPHADITKKLTPDEAKQINEWLYRSGFIDDKDNLLPAWERAVATGETKTEDLPEALRPYSRAIVDLVKGILVPPPVSSGRDVKNNVPCNENFKKKEFQELWKRINHKAIYQVSFDSAELIENAVRAIKEERLNVPEIVYVVKRGGLEVKENGGIEVSSEGTHTEPLGEHVRHVSSVRYDLVGKIAENTGLTRRTAMEILIKMPPAEFEKYPRNPEKFIAEVSRIVNEQKATTIVEKISYDLRTDSAGVYESDIFTLNGIEPEQRQHILKKHIFDYLKTDSKVEKEFAEELEKSDEVVVYAKLPGGFKIPTPVGDYNPDWAIAFKEGAVRHVYFVAETKGSLSTLDLRGKEDAKIVCARKFFKRISERGGNEVRYDVVQDYKALMDNVLARDASAVPAGEG